MDAITFYTTQAEPKWRVTSPYGPRTHPISGQAGTMHWGTDLIPLVSNRKIPIPWPYKITGTVIATRTMGGRGMTVSTRPDGTNELILMQHLDSYLVKPGQKVNYLDPIGICGTTGNSTGIHLHFEVKLWDGTDNGGAVKGNPADYTPVKAEPSNAFRPGDLVKATANLNIREGPTTQAAIKGRFEAGEEARVQGSAYNGEYANGYHWWLIPGGWVAERWLEKVQEQEPEKAIEITPETLEGFTKAMQEIAITVKDAAKALEGLIEEMEKESAMPGGRLTVTG